MMTENEEYTVYENDTLHHGSNLKVEHTLYYRNDDNIADLIQNPLYDVLAMKNESVSKEEAAYEKVKQAVKLWEKEAAVTSKLNRALAYLQTPLVTHTSNKWIDDRNDYKSISNMVYEMRYRIYEGYSWRSQSARWEVQWQLNANSPKYGHNIVISQQEKTYKSKEEAEKYMQGRIKAYAHLFTEISPPIPDNLVNHFSLYGQLFPGYITESMQKEQAAEKAENTVAEKKSSIRKQLEELKQKKTDVSKPEPQKKRSEPEIG